MEAAMVDSRMSETNLSEESKRLRMSEREARMQVGNDV